MYSPPGVPGSGPTPVKNGASEPPGTPGGMYPHGFKPTGENNFHLSTFEAYSQLDLIYIPY